MQNDYINASYVSAEETGQTYTLTQGPMNNTIGHIWKMVWEQGTVGIVMLCKWEERGNHIQVHAVLAIERGKLIMSGCYKVEIQQGIRSASSHFLSYLLLCNFKTNKAVQFFTIIIRPGLISVSH